MTELSLDDEILRCEECNTNDFVCELHSKMLEADITEFVKMELKRLKKL